MGLVQTPPDDPCGGHGASGTLHARTQLSGASGGVCTRASRQGAHRSTNQHAALSYFSVGLILPTNTAAADQRSRGAATEVERYDGSEA